MIGVSYNGSCGEEEDEDDKYHNVRSATLIKCYCYSLVIYHHVTRNA